MENQQATVTVAAQQSQPLNNPPAENGNEENSVEKTRKARITKIKEKVLPGVKITLLLSLIVYIAMLVIGILGVHHCPVEENIPLFLIATGAIGLLTKITTYMREHILRHLQVGYIESSLYTVEMVFLILGAYWVYKEYPPSYDPVDTFRYCRKRTYMMAFVYITIILAIAFVALAGFLFFLCCICCLTCISSKDSSSESTANERQGGSAA